VPGLAPAAKQQGEYVAQVILAREQHRPALPPFAYRNFGNLATIGRNDAIADFGRYRFTGFAGWLLWSAAHIFFLIGFRNRITVAIDWLWAYLTFERGARLISQSAPPPASEVSPTAPPLRIAPTGAAANGQSER
jgi:NADH dehydrogenase